MNVTSEVLLAEHRIRPFIRETPLESSLYFSQLTGANVFLKLENLQYTGSFKVRGAMNKLLALSAEQRAKGIVAASSGNHGIAVAFGLKTLQARGIIFVPNGASSTKVETIRRYGAEVRFHGDDSVLTEEYARAYAREHGMVYVSPYNDEQVIGGQGTIAIELARQLQQIDAVFVSVGGGGLISGIAGYLQNIFPNAVLVGCSPEHSPVMAASIKAQHIVEMESQPTLSDGTAGGLELNAITFPLCQKYVHDFILLSEEEIQKAMKLFMETQHQLLEGSAALPIAALLKQEKRFQDKNVVLVICGANISLQTLKTIL